jgi:GT2 family glycosyltransferase
VSPDAPRLTIVVVAYRGRDLLERCLRSLEEHPLRSGTMETHVVDNASGDDTPEFVRRTFPGVHVHALAHNSGFSFANNVVLRDAQSPYSLLLNPDTEVTEGALDAMIATLESRPDVGMVGCRLVQPDGTFDHAAKRGFPTPLGALSHFLGLSDRGGSKLGQYRAPDLGEHDVGEVDAVNGAFMLVRREALEDVGLLDEGYWLYMEDLDWCYRFWKKGWKVLYDGRATVVHVKGGTAGTHRALKTNWAFHRGMGRFYRQWYAGEKPALDALVYGGVLAKFAVAATRSTIHRRSLR